LHFQSLVTKRRKIETWRDDHYRSGASSPGFASSKAVVSTHDQGSGVIQVGKLTNVAPLTGSTEGHRPDMDGDGESCKAQRRALRARSRAIEEKLRHALTMHTR
jgi:hypothetical protein